MQTYSLNGQWQCLPDENDIGIEDKWFLYDKIKDRNYHLIPLKIPNSFNLIDGYDLYEGVFWFFYEFELKNKVDFSNFDYQIKFKGSNYNTRVWLNGFFIGEHEGGFTPFKFLINDHLKSNRNYLVVRVDNTRDKDGIPSIYFDWFNWGGIYRDVDIIILNKNRFRDVRITTEILTRKSAKIHISYKVIGKIKFEWQIIDYYNNEIIENGKRTTVFNRDEFSIYINNPRLWSPQSPALYQLQIIDLSLMNKRNILFQSDFGIRKIEVRSGGLYLNKKKIKLKGVSLHEELLPYGRTIPYNKRNEDLQRIKKIGFNSVRTAHYPHDEALLEIADKLGLLILEEIPVYWDCNYKSRKTFKLAAKMLVNLIGRDYNHPSVIWWSVGNEIPTHKKECAKFIENLMILAKNHDSSRIVTYVSRKLTSDLMRRKGDVAALNTYFGWYFGVMKMLSLILDWIRTPVLNKPWIFTEFGAGAKFGYRHKGKNPPKFSEEYQLALLDHTIKTINSKEYFSGWFIWIFRDFKTILKNNTYQQGFNRKGIVGEKSTEKKLIYYHLPKILNKKRKKGFNTKFIGIILWIIFFPFSHFITTHLVTLITTNVDKKTYKRGIQRLLNPN